MTGGRSELEAAEAARGHWVRIQSNMSAGGYDVFMAAECPATPEWPTLSFHELLRIAFKDKYIDGLDHPVLKNRGGRSDVSQPGPLPGGLAGRLRVSGATG